jgi:hypothetical protein
MLFQLREKKMFHSIYYKVVDKENTCVVLPAPDLVMVAHLAAVVIAATTAVQQR